MLDAGDRVDALREQFETGSGGRQLALTEAQLVLAGLLARFDVKPETEAVDDLRPAGVLQPRGGIPTTLRTP